METQASHRPIWQYLSIARTPIPTKALLVITVALIAFTIVAAITGASGPRALPQPSATREPQSVGNGQFLFSPQSAHVQQGIPYRFSLYTHCGLGYPIAVDFNGSFWQPTDPSMASPQNGNPPAGFANPTDQGVMILLSASQAEYHSSHGAVVEFRPRQGSVTTALCS
jgi:hypothetical protein